MWCAYDLTKSFLFVEDPGPEDIRTDVTLVPDPIPILIPIGDVLEADHTRQNTVVEGAVVILQCPTGEGTLAAEYVMFIKAEYQKTITVYVTVVQVTCKLNLTCCLVTGGYRNLGAGEQSLPLQLGTSFLGLASSSAVVEINWKPYHCKSVCADRMIPASICSRSWTLLISFFVTVPNICTFHKNKTFSVHACNLTLLISLTRGAKE